MDSNKLRIELAKIDREIQENPPYLRNLAHMIWSLSGDLVTICGITIDRFMRTAAAFEAGRRYESSQLGRSVYEDHEGATRFSNSGELVNYKVFSLESQLASAQETIQRLSASVSIAEWAESGRTAPPRDSGFARANRILASRRKANGSH